MTNCNSSPNDNKPTHFPRCLLVGGAVRDQLLGLEVTERDWVVVGSTPEQMHRQGFMPVGKSFPVFLHPDTKEEYALARIERKSGHGYAGFSFQADASVTLEEDLLRRDLTINAMAQDDSGTITDPYGGQKDLDQRILRHVSPAFVEDPLRVLRIARFAARFHHLGFRIADETNDLMRHLANSGELSHLVPERVWKETARALMTDAPQRYFEVLNDCGALAILFPEIAALDGVPQTAKHHPEVDTLKHLYLCLAQSAYHQHPLITRYAVLCHDLGKGLTAPEYWPKHHGHEHKGVAPTVAMSQRLGVPKDFSELAQLTSKYHLHCHRALELKASTLLSLFKSLDAERRPKRLKQFTDACLADSQGRLGFSDNAYPQAAFLLAMATAIKVDTTALVAEGLTGKAIGRAISTQAEQQLIEAKAEWLELHL